MKITKAVVTAAAPDQRSLPLQNLVDQDGQTKSALDIIVEEALSAGIESIAVVVHPGDADAYRNVAAESTGRLEFIPQKDPRGYGQALLSAREFVEDQPFLHFVSDHLCTSVGESPALRTATSSCRWPRPRSAVACRPCRPRARATLHSVRRRSAADLVAGRQEALRGRVRKSRSPRPPSRSRS